MRKRCILTFISILFISLLSGCWSSREINELAIAAAIGIDKSEEGYQVTVQLINPGEIAATSTTSRTAVTTYSASAETVFEAIRKLTLETPRKVYVAHVRVLVIGEELAKDGIAKILDFFAREPEMRPDFYIVIARDQKAEKVLDVLTPVDKIPGNKIFSSLEMSQANWAPTKAILLDELIGSLTSEGKSAVLTGLYIKGDPKEGTNIENVEHIHSPTIIHLSNLAVFKKDKLIGWLNESESKGLNYIEGNVKSTVFNVACSKGDKLSVELIRSKSKVKGKVENDEPKIDITIIAEVDIEDVECDIDLTNPEIISELEVKVSEAIRKVMVAAVNKAQVAFQSDIFGFGEAIHRADPKKWKEIKADWSKHFEKLEVNYDVTARIRRIGTITESFQKEASE